MCGGIVGQARAEELTEAVEACHAAGGAVYLATFTVRHGAGPPLSEVLDVVNRARRRLVGSRWWGRRTKGLGMFGWVRALEITGSEPSGWHPHTHWLLFFERPLSNWDFCHWWMELSQRWSDLVGRIDERFRPSSAMFGPAVDLRRVERDEGEFVAGYVVKDAAAGVGLEMARPEAKHGAGESLTPFEIGELAAKGSRWGRRMWREYCEATRGVHKLQWSRGLRDRLGLRDERTDDEILDDTDADEVVTDLDPEEAALVLAVREIVPLVCEAADRGGADEVHRVLRAALDAIGWAERARLRRWAADRFRRRRGAA